MLANMDEKADKPKKASSSTSKLKPKSAPKASTYTEGIDLPPSNEEDELEEQDQKQRPNVKPLEVFFNFHVFPKFKRNVFSLNYTNENIITL